MKHGELIRQKRKEKRLTLKEVSNACGISVYNLSDIEHGRRFATRHKEKMEVIDAKV